FAARMAGRLEACVPFEPDSNLVCLALNPAGNVDVAEASAFVRRLHDSLRATPGRPLQEREFFGSMTTLSPHRLGVADTRALLESLGLDPATLDPDSDGRDRLAVLR